MYDIIQYFSGALMPIFEIFPQWSERIELACVFCALVGLMGLVTLWSVLRLVAVSVSSAFQVFFRGLR